MAGFSMETARELFTVPEMHDHVTMNALGHPGDPESLPEALREKELGPRTPKPLDEIMLSDSFNKPFFQ